MVGRTASVISPFYSLLPDPGSLWGTPRQCTRSSLFIIFINDNYIAAGDIYILKKFADDTKLGQVMCSEGDADTRDMKFINSKCKILHVGKNNLRFNFFMNGAQLSESEEEKDLWVLVNKSLKPTSLCSEAARKANFNLGSISSAFHYRNRHVMSTCRKSMFTLTLSSAPQPGCHGLKLI